MQSELRIQKKKLTYEPSSQVWNSLWMLNKTIIWQTKAQRNRTFGTRVDQLNIKPWVAIKIGRAIQRKIIDLIMPN